MSEKINKAIEVIYQAVGAATGLVDVKMDVYDEAHAEDAAKSIAAMTEIGSTGRYYASFTPDAEGDWQVQIDSITAPGKVVKHYTVVAHDIDSVGDAIDGQNDISTGDIAGELATYDAPTKAELDLTESNIRGGSETLETIKTAVDAVVYVSPPIVG